MLNLITTFHKKEVKYSSLTELDAALDEWWDSAVTNGWTSTQLNSLAQYKRLLTVTWKDNPFSVIREYHKLWTKAVHSGRHDMFQVDGHIHLACMINAKINPNASPSTISHGKKPQKSSQADAACNNPILKSTRKLCSRLVLSLSFDRSTPLGNGLLALCRACGDLPLGSRFFLSLSSLLLILPAPLSSPVTTSPTVSYPSPASDSSRTHVRFIS